uniref:Uncharacterized protein n=1 Tax=Setaria digitata TaxID=48799 RepID=A0A915PJB2_9BILA
MNEVYAWLIESAKIYKALVSNQCSFETGPWEFVVCGMWQGSELMVHAANVNCNFISGPGNGDLGIHWFCALFKGFLRRCWSDSEARNKRQRCGLSLTRDMNTALQHNNEAAETEPTSGRGYQANTSTTTTATAAPAVAEVAATTTTTDRAVPSQINRQRGEFALHRRVAR